MTDDRYIPPVPSDGRSIYVQDQAGEIHHTPIPGMEICDFCSHAELRWRYAAATILIPDIGFASSDAWGACETCHRLIEANDRRGLTGRSVEGFARSAPAEGWTPTDRELRTIRMHMTIIQAAFFEARTGDATRV